MGGGGNGGCVFTQACRGGGPQARGDGGSVSPLPVPKNRGQEKNTAKKEGNEATYPIPDVVAHTARPAMPDIIRGALEIAPRPPRSAGPASLRRRESYRRHVSEGRSPGSRRHGHRPVREPARALRP